MTAEGGPGPTPPQGPQVGGGQVDGVLPYRRQAATSGQHPGHGQEQHRGQVKAHTASVAWVGDAPENLDQGWCDKAFVVEADISAASQNKGID